MTCPLRIFGFVIACACTAWQPSEAFAQGNSAQQDVQLWIYAIAQGEIGDGTRLTLDGSARWREEARGDEQQTLRFTIEQEVDDGLRLGGGFGVFETSGGATELRPHQQLNVSLGRFSARTRFEQRFFDDADRLEIRFRQRLRYTQPISDEVTASIDGEYFNLMQTRNRDRDAAVDQVRGRVIVTYHGSESFSLGASYLYIYTPQPSRADQINHVPQLVLTRRF